MDVQNIWGGGAADNTKFLLANIIWRYQENNISSIYFY